MRTVGWVDPAAKVKEVEQEQAEEPAPVLTEEPEAVEETERIRQSKRHRDHRGYSDLCGLRFRGHLVRTETVSDR